tara:strand:+ start:968 stop:1912 length:945 start_codon:yes stop_codon:yes gene_type:complete
MALTKVTLTNLALSKIGSDRLQITDFDNDTTIAGSQARLHYDVTLEELARMHSWNCCKKRTQVGAFKINLLVGGGISILGGFEGNLTATGTDSNGRPTYTTGTSGTNGYVNLVYDNDNSRWQLTMGYNNSNSISYLSSTIYNPNGNYNGGASQYIGVTITVVKPEFEYDYSYRIPSDAERSFYVTDSSAVYNYIKPRVDWHREGNAILTNEPKLFLCYDAIPEPNDMDSLFAKTFYTMLAMKLAVPITGDRDLEVSLLKEIDSVILPEARRVNGFERQDPPTIDSEWLEATVISPSSLSNSWPPFSQISYGSFE